MPERGGGGARLIPFPGTRPAKAPPAPPPALERVRLARGGRVLLDGATLSLPGRGVTALMGPNGAGKSLLLRVAAGLVPPDAGAVRLKPEETALMLQRTVLLRRSVRGNLSHALRAAGAPRAARAARVAELLAISALEALADRQARALSGGEAQRLALARALAGAPRLLLLDEPSASLDPRSTAALEALIRRVADAGVEVALVCHDRGQAERLADRVAFMHHGRVLESGPAGDLLARPRSEAARAYLEGRLPL